MKTKDLIKHLQEIDPNGEFEICIENADIEYIDVLPAYYDGRITIVKERDEYMRSLKSEVTGVGTKINLFRHDWTDRFSDEIMYNLAEYIVESGGGAAGQKGYNWLDAEVISRKIKITHIIDTYDFLDNIEEVRLFTKELRVKYIDLITEQLTKYSKILNKKIGKTALILIEKCKEINFPLEVFRHGSDYVVNQNYHWRGYEFKIDNQGKFYIKDSVNNKQYEELENGRRDITPYVETNIMEFDFNIINAEYMKALVKMDKF